MICLSTLVCGKITLSEVKDVCFEKEFDVIVCGLGTSGALAALFSAENGLSVLGIETLNCVGGTHTAGGVPGHYFGRPGGHYEALDERIKDFAQKYTCTAVESRIFLTEKELVENGVDIRYSSTVCGVYLDENNRVLGVNVLEDGKITPYKAKVVMDCTADAYVAAMAGCETQFGRELDSKAQPYSVVSMVYDGKKYGYNNVDFGRVDQRDTKSLSRAIIFSRSYPIKEGFDERAPIAQMQMIGVREGRRIVPEEGVSIYDLFADRQTQAPMFYSYADLDKHGWDIAFDGEALGDWAIGANLGAYNVTVAVPYKAILPKGYDGILVPCRALGVDRDVSSCVRMNLDMKKVAEAGAKWATLAIKQNKRLADVSYSDLKEKLLSSGCLKYSDNIGYRIDGKRNFDKTPLVPRDVHWISDPCDLEATLRTLTPGIGIWSAKRMKDTSYTTLRGLIASNDENTRKHAAFAMAAIGKSDANEILAQMVKDRDPVMLTDCRKNNNIRACMAIYWLGRLADIGITEELADLETVNYNDV